MMDINKNEAEKKRQEAAIAMQQFFEQCVKYMGKEIKLQSSQFFWINYLVEDKSKPKNRITDEKDIYPRHSFQYGFPQSGCVSLDIVAEGEHKGKACNILVTAPSADKKFVSVVYDDKKDLGQGLSIRSSHGVDMGFEEHRSLAEIGENPNALKMIQLATDDLSKAKIMGDDCAMVLDDSDTIPNGRSI